MPTPALMKTMIEEVMVKGVRPGKEDSDRELIKDLLNIIEVPPSTAAQWPIIVRKHRDAAKFQLVDKTLEGDRNAQDQLVNLSKEEILSIIDYLLGECAHKGARKHSQGLAWR